MSKLPDRVAIIGTSIPGGGAALSVHLRKFLESHGVMVDFYDGHMYTLREYQRQRANPETSKKPVLKRVLQEVAHSLNERVYPVVIAIEREDVFLEKLPSNTRRFYFCTAPLAYERYYGWLYQGLPDAERRLQRALEIERSIYAASDVITFAWNTYESFVRENVYDGDNIVSHPGLGWYGCLPQPTRVNYQDSCRIVYLGHIDYWSNPALLAELTKKTPYPIDCYGQIHVPVTGVQHFGYVKDEWRTLNGFLLGLNAVSTDPLRVAGFSSKLFTYMSVGLPALSPAWQQFSHQVAGVIPYQEENFVELVEQVQDQDLWQSASDQAYAQAHELRWEKVLEPILDLLKE